MTTEPNQPPDRFDTTHPTEADDPIDPADQAGRADSTEGRLRILPRFNRLALAAVCVGVVTLLVFWPCVDHGFLRWDDDENIVDNESFRGLGPSHLLWMLTTTHMGPYQPLSWLSYAVDHTVWGLDPYGYHLTNILLHAVSAGLLVWLASLVFAAWREASPETMDGERSYMPRQTGASRLACLAGVVAGLAWAIHPQRVESVAWVTERRDVLCGVFFLLCLITYMKGHRSQIGSVVRGWWLWMSRLACLLAILSKGTAVSLPAVLLILDAVPLGRLRGPVRSWLAPSQRGVLLEKGSYLVFSLLGVGIGLWGQWQGGGLQPLDEVGPIQRLAIACHAIVFYLMKLVLPVGLSPMYARPESVPIWSVRFGGAMVGVVAVTALLVVMRGRRPWPIAVWAAYVTMLLPVSGLVTIGHELVADRYSYLATLAMFVVLGVGLAWWWGCLQAGISRVAMGVPAGVVLVIWLATTRDLIAVWHNDVALWERAVAVDPDAARAQTNLGGAYLLAGRPQDAAKALERAITLSPDAPKAHHNLGTAYRALHKLDRALACYSKAIELDVDYVFAWHARGLLLTEMKRYDEAIRDLTKASLLAGSSSPNSSPAISEDVGDAYLAKGQLNAAIDIYLNLVRTGYVTRELFASLAEAYLRAGHTDKAADLLLRAPKGVAGSAEVHYAMARVRTQQGRLIEALNELRSAVHLDGACRARARFDELLAPLREDARFQRLLSSTATVLP